MPDPREAGFSLAAAGADLDGSPAAVRLVEDLVGATADLQAGRLDERAYEERLRSLWGAWLDHLGEEND